MSLSCRHCTTPLDVSQPQGRERGTPHVVMMPAWCRGATYDGDMLPACHYDCSYYFVLIDSREEQGRGVRRVRPGELRPLQDVLARLKTVALGTEPAGQQHTRATTAAPRLR